MTKNIKEKPAPTVETTTPLHEEAPPEAKIAPIPGFSLAHAELLMRMMAEYRIDEVKFGIIEIKKSFHMPPEEAKPKKELSEDDLLFYSAK